MEPVVASFDVDEGGLTAPFNLSISDRTIEEQAHYEIVVTMLPQSELHARVRIQRDVGGGALAVVSRFHLKSGHKGLSDCHFRDRR